MSKTVTKYCIPLWKLLFKGLQIKYKTSFIKNLGLKNLSTWPNKNSETHKIFFNVAKK